LEGLIFERIFAPANREKVELSTIFFSEKFFEILKIDRIASSTSRVRSSNAHESTVKIPLGSWIARIKQSICS